VLDGLAAVGVVAFGGVSLVVGVRLLALAARTRELPELAIGTGFVVGVLLGFVPESLVYSSDLVAEAWVLPLVRMAEISIRVCAFAILVFTWRVFRPEARHAVVLVGGIGALLVVSHWAAPYGARFADDPGQVAWSKAAFAARTAPLLWGMAESLRYWRASRRRMALGLADPMLTNRFLLWGIAMGAAGFLMGSVLIAPLFGLSAAERIWLLLESGFGCVAAAAIWLTFFPPAAYRRWLTAGTAVPAT